MFAAIAAIASLAVAAVSATPIVLQARDNSQPCVTNSIANFTLAAWNTNIMMPNANSTGAPLVLGFGSASESAEWYATSTWASYPYNDYPFLTLADGGMTAHGSNVAGASYTEDGNELTWAMPLQGSPQVGFCATAGNDGYELAIHGDPNSWWLCPSHLNEVNVVYKPAENRGTVYNYDSCYPVLLKIVENSS